MGVGSLLLPRAGQGLNQGRGASTALDRQAEMLKSRAETVGIWEEGENDGKEERELDSDLPRSPEDSPSLPQCSQEQPPEHATNALSLLGKNVAEVVPRSRSPSPHQSLGLDHFWKHYEIFLFTQQVSSKKG